MSENNIFEEVEFFDDVDEIVTLTDDDGNEVDFIIVAQVKHEDKFYAFLQPAEEMEDFSEDEAAIFLVEEEDEDTDLYTPVEDEALLDTVFEKYRKAVDILEAEEAELEAQE